MWRRLRGESLFEGAGGAMQQRVCLRRKTRYSRGRLTVSRGLTYVPGLYPCVRLAKRVLSYARWRCRVHVRKRKNFLDFDRIFWIRTDDIVDCTRLEFDPVRYDGAVLGTDWDVTEVKFVDLDVFRAFEDHFRRGVAWQETEFFANTLRRIEEGETPWKCRSEGDLIRRCKYLDRLFASIREAGYQLQTGNLCGFLGVSRIDEISVNIARDGRLLFNNGAHRLAIAKLLNIQRIPVRVTVVHALCRDFRLLHHNGEHDPLGQRNSSPYCHRG